MIEHLPHATLEYAIESRLRLDALCSRPCPHLYDFRIADYVGDFRLRYPMGVPDLASACARVFFEDDAPLLRELDGRNYGIVLFATFAVVEFNAFTHQAHFLVLAPILPAGSSIEAPYAGLWAAQRMDRLQDQDDPTLLFEETDNLIEALRRPPPQQPYLSQRTWWQRLMGR